MSEDTKRGFASFDEAKRKLIAAMGGKRAHALQAAHQWTSDSARAAGQKGGLVSAARRKAKREAAAAARETKE